jgi:Phosphotransferase enzyme family
VHASDVVRALDAAGEVASELGLPADDAKLLHNSNKLALRLLPCDVLARVAFAGSEEFATELDIARKLTEVGAPVASLEPRVESRVYERHGFALTLWTYYEQAPPKVSPDDYANALERLHAGMSTVGVPVLHFSERVAEAQELIASPDRTPTLEDPDRALLARTLDGQIRQVSGRSSAEQLLHGEPHVENLLNTEDGPLFIDLETCCRGPVEFDLAHTPAEVSERYAGADRELLLACRLLVLAMVAAWRWDRDDQFPNRERAGQELLDAIRAGPPWPALEVVTQRARVR